MSDSIEIKLSGNLKFFLEKMSLNYLGAANYAARKAAFVIYGICQKDYLSVVDGVSRRTKNSRPTPRTTFLGLRRPTGNLARNVKMGVYNDGTLSLITGPGAKTLDKKLLDGAAVGIGDNVKYGIYQEAGGRDRIPRKDGNMKFHPFLAPALEDARPQIKQIFDAEFLKAKNRPDTI